MPVLSCVSRDDPFGAWRSSKPNGHRAGNAPQKCAKSLLAVTYATSRTWDNLRGWSSTPGSSNRHTVSSHDRDCHTIPFKFPVHIHQIAPLSSLIIQQGDFCGSETRPRDALFFSLSSPQKHTNFMTQPNSQWLMSYFSMWTNSHQYKQRESRCLLDHVKEKPERSFVLWPVSTLSSSLFSHTDHSSASGTWLASMKLGRWGFCLLGNIQLCCYCCCWKNVVPFYSQLCKCKNVGKDHRGQSHTGRTSLKPYLVNTAPPPCGDITTEAHSFPSLIYIKMSPTRTQAMLQIYNPNFTLKFLHLPHKHNNI